MQDLINCGIEFHAVHGAFPRAVSGGVRDRACRRVVGAQNCERRAVSGARGKIVATSNLGALKVHIWTNGRLRANEVMLQVVGAKVQLCEDAILDGLWVVVSCLQAGEQSSWEEACWLIWPRNVEVREFLSALWGVGAICDELSPQRSFDAETLYSKTGVSICTASSLQLTGRSAARLSTELSRTSDNEKVVVKVVRRDLQGRNVLNEVAMLAAVQWHPNIIKFQSLILIGQGVNEAWGIVQQWCRNGDLLGELQEGPRDERRGLCILADVACGMEHIHRRGIVHRDLKAEHVFRLGDTCVLGDFGSAAYEANRAAMSQQCGTLGYIAPELVLRQYNHCSFPLDVFSAGVLLYLLLGGSLPFGDGRNRKKTCRLSCQARIKFIAPEFAPVSRACKRLIPLMCKQLPRDRPSASTVGMVSASLVRKADADRSVAPEGGVPDDAGAASAYEPVATIRLEGDASMPSDGLQNGAVDAACASFPVTIGEELVQTSLGSISIHGLEQQNELLENATGRTPEV
eukprot:TRINITY_DN31074_c0_g1_i1.p1 TRINITY_DN31074_c0_g1~~TRINITY_DN31074_c0_g1_i1.p1  ORF type:complete len:517 (-),score=38.56 TRINITY_DN31074_c0_g1_i1:571-2121(-)